MSKNYETAEAKCERLKIAFPSGCRVRHKFNKEEATVLEVQEPDEYEDVWIRVSWDGGFEHAPDYGDESTLERIDLS